MKSYKSCCLVFLYTKIGALSFKNCDIFILLQTGFQGVHYTERCRIFNEFHGRLDQNAIKLRFMHKLRSTGPPPKHKEKVVKRPAMVVPKAIKCQYALPPPSLPLPNEKPRLVCMTPEGFRSNSNVCSPEEQEEVSRPVMCSKLHSFLYI